MHKDFGEISFKELTASQVQFKFNALYGSNTKPRAQFKSPADNVKDFAHLKKLSDQKVHFDGLFAVTSQD